MKLDLKDIVLLNEGQQAKRLIESRFGSLKSFYEKVNTHGLSLKAIRNYCCYQKISSDAFKFLLINEFDMSWNEIVLDDINQIKKYVDAIYTYIFLYKEENDLKLFEKLDELAKQYNMTNERAILKRCMAKYYFYMNNSAKTIELYHDALDIVSNICFSTAIILNVELADHLFMERRCDESQIYYKIAESYINKANISEGALYVYYYRMGVMLNTSGQYQQAREHFQKALNYGKINTEEISQTGAALMAIGTTLKRDAKYEEAREFYLKSLPYFHVDDINGRSTALNNIADIYSLLGDYINAIKYIEEALRALEKYGFTIKYLIFLETYAETKYLIGDFTGCYQYFDVLKETLNTSINKNKIKISICNFINLIGSKDVLEQLEATIYYLISNTRNEIYKDDLYSCLGRLNVKIHYRKEV
jgi:tetratricopeptide (TPR) repeat protein